MDEKNATTYDFVNSLLASVNLEEVSQFASDLPEDGTNKLKGKLRTNFFISHLTFFQKFFYLRMCILLDRHVGYTQTYCHPVQTK